MVVILYMKQLGDAQYSQWLGYMDSSESRIIRRNCDEWDPQFSAGCSG
jgi:hypothetical protein